MCLEALELCSKRFQEHFKSLYHLGYFYFKNKKHKNLDKVKQLLLDQGGLFYERKPSNFFNGIWRIPNNEIDRPGSFAAYMGRCVHLLLDYLMETKDYKMLVDLALHLKIVPEPDKKYLRDNEREELFREALSLSAQVLRKRLQEINGDCLKLFIMDVYFIHKKVSKSSLKEPMFGIVLSDAYCKLTGSKTDNNIEAAIKYCKQERASQRAATASAAAANATTSTNVATSILSNNSVIATTTTGITITPIPSGSTTVATTVPVINVPAPVTPAISVQATQSAAPTFIPTITKTNQMDDLDKELLIGGLSKARGTSTRGNSGKRPRGRPPLSQTRARHSLPPMQQMAVSFMQQCTNILQQNPEWCRQFMAMTQTPGAALPQTPQLPLPLTNPPQLPLPLTNPQLPLPLTNPPQLSLPLTNPPQLSLPLTNPPQLSLPLSNPPQLPLPLTNPPQPLPSQPPPPQTIPQTAPAPLVSAKGLGLSITPVTLSSSKSPLSPVQSRPPRTPLSLPCSISITSVPPKQSFASMPQSVTVTPAPKMFPDPKLPSPAPGPSSAVKIELSLQHKILSAKRSGPRATRSIPLNSTPLVVPTIVPRSLNLGPRPRFPAPRPRGADPNRQVARRGTLKPQFPPEILNQLSITPSASKRESYMTKNPPHPGPPPPKIPLLLDSTVAQAIKNFGTSITITPAPKPVKTDSEISVTPAKPPQPSTSSSSSKPSGDLPVIVLDD